MEIPSFILPANGQATPEMVARRRKLAETLMGQGIDTSPVESPWQAVGRIGEAAIGGYSDYKAGQQEQEGRKSAQGAMADLLQSDKSPSNASIIGAMNNPWITDSQGRMAAMLLEDNLKRAAPKDPIKVGPGDTIISGDNYKPVYQGGPKVTDDITEFEYSQNHPGAAEFWQSLKRAGASQTNIDMKGQSKYSEERGKGRAENANNIEKDERAAQQSITSLGAMENAMNDPNFYSGFMANGVQSAKKFAVMIGGDPNQVASTETFNSFAKQAALASMGGSLGTGFSNADRDFVESQVPTLANTPEGNKSLIGIHRKIAERKIQIARMMRDYEDAHGQLDNGFLDQLSQWAEQNPIFPQQQQQQPTSQFDLMTQPQYQQPPQQPPQMQQGGPRRTRSGVTYEIHP
jgi:hypothetical protein